MPPLFVHTTIEPAAIVMLAGVKPELVTETWTVVGCSFGVGVGVGLGTCVGDGFGVVARIGTPTTIVGVAVGLAICVGVAVGPSEGVAVRPDVVDWSEGVGVTIGVDADLCPNNVETP